MLRKRLVLEALAATESGEELSTNLPKRPLIWLSQNPVSLNNLPTGSRWILWPVSSSQPELVNRNYPGFVIQSDQSLQLQLQQPLK
jgi:hypothetical protein